MTEVAEVAGSMASSDRWAAWEPEEWVSARGAACSLQSEHFVVRWGEAGPSTARAYARAPSLLEHLERVWAVLCEPTSADFFCRPYSARGWCASGEPRKMNVYIGDTGLAPHPGTGWAHQGTYVERGVEAVRHARANPEAKLHHSYLALAPGAAESDATVAHELAHCLQMHTGGHIDSDRVGYQWEAHAEYCTHLVAERCPHLPAFLETSHLPVDATDANDAEGSGRQYIVWPFYAWLDRHLGAPSPTG